MAKTKKLVPERYCAILPCCLFFVNTCTTLSMMKMNRVKLTYTQISAIVFVFIVVIGASFVNFASYVIINFCAPIQLFAYWLSSIEKFNCVLFCIAKSYEFGTASIGVSFLTIWTVWEFA